MGNDYNLVMCPDCKQPCLNTILGTCCSCGHKISYAAFTERQKEIPENKTATPKNKEMVNHPKHYGGDNIYETIKVIEAWELDFHLGNVVKYISRAGKKQDILEDLKKARWYLDRKISLLESQKQEK